MSSPAGKNGVISPDLTGELMIENIFTFFRCFFRTIASTLRRTAYSRRRQQQLYGSPVQDNIEDAYLPCFHYCRLLLLRCLHNEPCVLLRRPVHSAPRSSTAPNPMLHGNPHRCPYKVGTATFPLVLTCAPAARSRVKPKKKMCDPKKIKKIKHLFGRQKSI